jgi:pyruvate dehydrogenase E2 component (dihydrolipoamide acetyltransferase)
MTDFRMPSLGADMRFGTVVEWKVHPGDRIRRGDVIAEVETEKGVFSVDATRDGVVDELVVAKGSKAPVGAVLAHIREAGEPGPSVPAPEAAPKPPMAPPPAPPAARPRASPLARRLAAEGGIDLASLASDDHVVRRAEVERAIAAKTAETPAASAPAAPVAPAPSPEAGTPDARTHAMRQAIAAAVSRSKREIPHYYLAADIDLGRASAWLLAENAQRAVTDRLLAAAQLLKAVAVGLRDFPDLNGFWTEGAFRASHAIHVGVAISLRTGGLIAPAIHDADSMPLNDLSLALRSLVQRARSGGVRGSEMTDPTITVTNLGEQGVDEVFGVIYPPQVALVGFGRINDRPWAEAGMLGVRPVVTASLAADHRVTDGHYGGRFLTRVAELLRSPEAL